jgi:hypothetical protein
MILFLIIALVIGGITYLCIDMRIKNLASEKRKRCSR